MPDHSTGLPADIRALKREPYYLAASIGIPSERAYTESEVDALLQAAAELAERAEPRWRPIETAPKDGTDIMLSNGVAVSVGHWFHEEGGIREHRDLDGRYIGQDESEGFDGWIDWGGGMLPEPSCWMPLPAAPGASTPPAPVDMVLHCPKCGRQHVDGQEEHDALKEFKATPTPWTNPPHRSHLCHGCGHIWRPADVPTNGVAAVKTKGNADSPLAAPPAPDAGSSAA